MLLLQWNTHLLLLLLLLLCVLLLLQHRHLLLKRLTSPERTHCSTGTGRRVREPPCEHGGAAAAGG